MESAKLAHIVEKLTARYAPFNTLSRERCAEAINNMRVMELGEGDELAFASRSDDYCLLIVEGLVSVIDQEGVSTIQRAPDTVQYPMVIAGSTGTTSVLAHEDTVFCHVEHQLLDDMVAWDEVKGVIESANPALGSQLECIRNSRVFRRLPFECVEAAFSRMKKVEVDAGDVIIRQGDPASAYYIIKSGSAEVYFKEIFEEEPELVARLSEGDAFGSEALISGRTRNETVRMSTPGVLLELGKQDFEALIHKSFIRTANNRVAHAMLKSRYRLLDVRSQEEHDESHIPGSQLIPLGELRERIGQLDPSRRYIVYCQSGNRSAMAALLLAEYQIEAYSMDGGMRDWPYEKKSVFLKMARNL